MTAQRRTKTTKPIGRPPGSTAEDTISRLLDAALVHFGSRGYAGARMTEIADAAGVTHSSIYQYFASKRDLYRAVFDTAQSDLLPRYLEAIDAGATLREQIKAIFRASARTHARNPVITAFLASVPLEIRRHPDLLPSLAEGGTDMLKPLTAMFDRARARSEIAHDADDLSLLVAFIGAAMGVGLLSYGIAEESMDPAIDILLATLDGHFFSPGPSTNSQ